MNIRPRKPDSHLQSVDLAAQVCQRSLAFTGVQRFLHSMKCLMLAWPRPQPPGWSSRVNIEIVSRALKLVALHSVCKYLLQQGSLYRGQGFGHSRAQGEVMAVK